MSKSPPSRPKPDHAPGYYSGKIVLMLTGLLACAIVAGTLWVIYDGVRS